MAKNIKTLRCINPKCELHGKADEGGDIFVSSRIVELNQCYCDASMADISQGKYTEIEFRDTGCGIELSRIFEPFYTTKERGKGTGLGLAAVQGTVQQHKGTITVYSEVGSGTCFHIFLPLTEEDMPVKSAARDEKITGTGTILIVDDERVMRATASAILEELGYKMLSAENGLEGLELFKQEMKRIDLVILDMVMPEMNGQDCFLAMKEIKPDVRVLLSSGFSREEEVAVMKQKGLKGFIRKPFRSAELSCAVRDAMQMD